MLHFKTPGFPISGKKMFLCCFYMKIKYSGEIVCIINFSLIPKEVKFAPLRYDITNFPVSRLLIPLKAGLISQSISKLPQGKIKPAAPKDCCFSELNCITGESASTNAAGKK